VICKLPESKYEDDKIKINPLNDRYNILAVEYGRYKFIFNKWGTINLVLAVKTDYPGISDKYLLHKIEITDEPFSKESFINSIDTYVNDHLGELINLFMPIQVKSARN
jgi:hypothetical protein